MTITPPPGSYRATMGLDSFLVQGTEDDVQHDQRQGRNAA